MRDAFAVLFFVSVGMLFDPAILLDHPWLVLATLLIIIVGNALVAFAFVRLLKLPMGTALTISVSLSQIGEFSFILAGLGLTLKILPQEGHDLILAGALLSIIVNPFLFTLLDRWQARQNIRKRRTPRRHAQSWRNCIVSPTKSPAMPSSSATAASAASSCTCCTIAACRWW